MLAVFTVAIGLFVVTHVDTLFVLVAFFRDEHYQPPEIAVGHFVGVGVGLLGAILLAAAAERTFYEFAFLLGAVPLGIGVLGMRRRSEKPTVSTREVFPGRLHRIGIVATTGIGLSGENIAVFVPFFVTLTLSEMTAVVAAFLVFAGLLLPVAFFLARWIITVSLPGWIEDRFVPALLIVVGGYVLVTGWIAADVAV